MSRAAGVVRYINGVRRDRTPRIEGFTLVGDLLRVTFDRPMDVLHTTARFRYVDPSGILDFTDFAWDGNTVIQSSTHVPVTGDYDGPTKIVYMAGDIRAYERYFVWVGSESDHAPVFPSDLLIDVIQGGDFPDVIQGGDFSDIIQGGE